MCVLHMQLHHKLNRKLPTNANPIHHLRVNAIAFGPEKKRDGSTNRHQDTAKDNTHTPRLRPWSSPVLNNPRLNATWFNVECTIQRHAYGSWVQLKAIDVAHVNQPLVTRLRSANRLIGANKPAWGTLDELVANRSMSKHVPFTNAQNVDHGRTRKQASTNWILKPQLAMCTPCFHIYNTVRYVN